MLLLSTWYVHHLLVPNHYSPHTTQKTLEGHAAPKATTLQKYSTTFRALFDAPGVMEYVISTLPLHLCCQSWLTVPLFQSYQGTELLVPEGQVFISLDNLNSGAFRELSAKDMITILRHYKHYQHPQNQYIHTKNRHRA